MFHEVSVSRGTPRRDAILVLGAFTLQLVLLRVDGPGIAPAVTAAATLLAMTVGRYSPGRLIGSLKGLLFMLIAVLVARLVTDFSVTTFHIWLSYASRILSAVMVALTLIGRVGPGGVQRGITALLTPFPAVVTRPVLDMIATTIYLLPAVRRQLTGSVAVARVRLSRSGTGTLQRIAMISRAGLVSLVALPAQRAEAMLVRGLLDSRRHDRSDNPARDGGAR